MKKVLVLCEGQTEETFIRDVLAPHLVTFDKHLIPTQLVTKETRSGKQFRGGVAVYSQIRRHIQNLLRDKHAACVTTMLDYYGLPSDFPGKQNLQGNTPHARVAWLEKDFARDINDHRFLPYLTLHEFEALLFANPAVIFDVLAQPVQNALFRNLNRFSSPEEIDDGQATHPAARIRQHLPGYRKPLHGPLIAKRIGLPAIRSQCSHFDAWLRALEQL